MKLYVSVCMDLHVYVCLKDLQSGVASNGLCAHVGLPVCASFYFAQCSAEAMFIHFFV